MNEQKLTALCQACLGECPKTITRCAVGQGNYVYIVVLSDRKVVVRCSEEAGAYKDTIYWLERLMKEADNFSDYFAGIKPIAYLDDISTKNLLIHKGWVSGVIDIDWMGVGDKLTYVAMTNMALLNMGCDTDYVTFLLEEMTLTEEEKSAFKFYSLLFCVDFMGERGMCFMDKQIPVSSEIVEQMNGIYDKLWLEYRN